MLLVKTKLRKSKIHGLGLFADQDIKRGTVVWCFVPGFDRKFTVKQWKALPTKARQYLGIYAWRSNVGSGVRCVCLDQASYFNHADKPNCYSGKPNRKVHGERVTVALRDIRKGEELTDDYRTFKAG